MFLNFDKWLGINTQIESEKKPIYVVEEQVNLEIARKPGALTRRKPYVNIITATLTAIKGIFEFKDTNDVRSLLIQDGTGLEESVVTAGSYAATTALANDEREATPLVDQMYPTLYENELRSGAGWTTAKYVPFWFGHIAAKTRYPNSTTPIVISAGKYMYNQDIKYWQTLLDVDVTGDLPFVSLLSGEGAAAGYYIIYVAPVLSDGQRGFPININTNVGAYGPYYYLSAQGALNERITIATAEQSNAKRVRYLDIFVGYMGENKAADLSKVNAYFLERVDLEDDGDSYFQTTASSDSGANTLTLPASSTWKTFDPSNCVIYNRTQTEYYKVTSVADNVLTVTPGPTSTQAGDNIEFFGRWFLQAGSYQYKIVYDDYYKKLGSEMYTYLGLPLGDNGITDFRYKYSAINGKRLLICGVTDHPGGNYSVPYGMDVFPALNVFRTPEEPVGCIPYGEDFIIFQDRDCTHLSIYGNENSRQIDNFMRATIVGQKAVAAAGKDLLFGFDYEGPWMLSPRTGLLRIGDSLFDWWDTTLTETVKDGCVVVYNRLKNQVLFHFPDYATAPYTAGIGFVFDIKGWEDDKIYPWFYFVTDIDIVSWCTATDNHTLAAAATKIVDYSQDGGTDETVSSWVKLKVIKNRLAGKKRMWIDTLALEYTGETLTVEIFEDGGSAVDVSSDLTTNEKIFLRRFLEEFQLKITPAAGTGVFKFVTGQLSYNERTF